MGGNAQNMEPEGSNIELTLKLSGQQDQMLNITGITKNLVDKTMELRYELSVTVSNKKTQSSSKSAQSGSFTLHPFESQELSQTSVSTGRGSKSIVLLSIYRDNTLLAETKRVFGNQAPKEKNDWGYTPEYQVSFIPIFRNTIPHLKHQLYKKIIQTDKTMEASLICILLTILVLISTYLLLRLLKFIRDEAKSLERENQFPHIKNKLQQK